MTTIRLTSHHRDGIPGDTIDVPADEAALLVRHGLASIVEDEAAEDLMSEDDASPDIEEDDDA